MRRAAGDGGPPSSAPNFAGGLPASYAALGTHKWIECDDTPSNVAHASWRYLDGGAPNGGFNFLANEALSR